jgi:hypothetical protein
VAPKDALKPTETLHFASTFLLEPAFLRPLLRAAEQRSVLPVIRQVSIDEFGRQDSLWCLVPLAAWRKEFVPGWQGGV